MSKTFLYNIMVGVCLLAFVSCGQNTSEAAKEDAKTVEVTQARSQESPRIQIYSFGKAINPKAALLQHELKKLYPSVELVAQPLVLPVEYYNKEQNKYSGTGLLKYLSKRKNGTAVLGVTDEVIFKANELSPTYGIFGVSPVGARVALISTTMPSRKKLSDDHLTKLMLHELGHAFGLKHCSDEHCFMVDAEHGNKFSQTPSFCKDCKQYLNKRGWTL